MKEEKDPADETAFMWNVAKLEKLEDECAAAAGPTVYFDKINFVLSYAKSLLQYFKRMCRNH